MKKILQVFTGWLGILCGFAFAYVITSLVSLEPVQVQTELSIEMYDPTAPKAENTGMEVNGLDLVTNPHRARDSISL